MNSPLYHAQLNVLFNTRTHQIDRLIINCVLKYVMVLHPCYYSILIDKKCFIYGTQFFLELGHDVAFRFGALLRREEMH